MARITSAYIDIKMEHLKGKKIFPFALYLHTKKSNKYVPFLITNMPLVQSKATLLDNAIKEGGKLAVANKDLEKFLNFSGLSEIEFEKNSNSSKGSSSNQEGSSSNPKDLKDSPPPEENFHFQQELATAIKNDNFQNIIDQVRREVELFKLTISPTVSLSKYLVSSLMTGDNFNNRIAAVSYCFAKILNMKTEDVLADILCAAFFHNLGIVQLHGSWAHAGFLKLNGDERKKYMKHPKVSLHMLKKVGLELSDRSYRIIMEHHERIDGSGYPQGKIGDQIEPLALVLGAISHIFEYSTGRITGDNVQLAIILKSLKSKSYSSGLEYQFGDSIIETLVNLIDLDQKETKEVKNSDDKSHQKEESKVA